MNVTNYFLKPKYNDSYTNLPEFAFTHPQEYAMKPVQYGMSIDCPEPEQRSWNSFLHPWHELENRVFSHLIKFFDQLMEELPPADDCIDAPSHHISNLEASEMCVESTDSILLQLNVFTEIPNRDSGITNHGSDTIMYGY